MLRTVYYRNVGELAAYFLRLGLTAFGGPAAHIALMQADCVERRHWITRERFLDVLGASNLIPGPTSTELAMHIGFARAGWPGLVVAGVCFIAPPALMVAAIAALYVQAGALPALGRMLVLVKPVVVVVVAAAVINLAKAVRWSPLVVSIAAGAAMLALAGLNEGLVLVLAGLACTIARRWPRGSALAVVPLPDLFVYFVKAGSLVLGSGYVLLPILEGDLVQGARWISQAQLLDAIAVGQVTPGPVFTAATFIGYVIAGPWGALAATLGIFLPAFVFSALSVRVLERVNEYRAARSFLDGVSAAAVALIAAVVVALARHALLDLPAVAAGAAAVVLVLCLRVNAAWVILGAAAVGLFL